MSVEDETVIEACFSNDSLSKLSKLLQDGASANATDTNNWKALHHASHNGVLGIVTLLVDYGAQVQAITKDSKTALHLAASEGHIEVVRLLLDRGSNVNALDVSSESPLHKAALKGHLETVRALVSRPVNLDQASTLGYTPLHHAARLGHLPIVKLLIESGADFVACAADKRSALDMASDGKFASVAYFLTIIATKRLREAAALSSQSDGIVSIESEEVSRTLDESGGVIQTRTGAQVWLSQGALPSPQKFTMSLVPELNAEVPVLLEEMKKDRAPGPAMLIRTDNYEVPVVCRLPVGGSGVAVWRYDKEWSLVEGSKCAVTPRFVDVTLETSPRCLLTTTSTVSVTVLAFAGLWRSDPDVKKSGIRLIVFVIPDHGSVRTAMISKVREQYPELRLCGERFFPMLMNVGSGISVACPKHQPLKRTYINQALAFEATVFAKSTPIRVETENGFVDIMVNLIAPPEKPHTPLVESAFSDTTTVSIPAPSKSIFGGFEDTTQLEVRYLAFEKTDGTKIPSMPELEKTIAWKVQQLPVGSRMAKLPFNFAAYVEARAVSSRDNTIASPWSRTLLVKPGDTSARDNRQVVTDMSPTSSFDDGETPNISHRSFNFEINPRLDDPEAWADKCASAVKLAKLNRRGCKLLAHRAAAVAYACKHLDVCVNQSGGSRTVDEIRESMDASGQAVVQEMKYACDLISRCGEKGWFGRMLTLTDWAEQFTSADQKLVSSAEKYGVHENAIGGSYLMLHSKMESIYCSVLFELGLARMHLAAVLFPHLESWATVKECLGTAPNLFRDLQMTKEEFNSEVQHEEFHKAVTISREKRHKATEGSFPASMCQVYVSGVVEDLGLHGNGLLRLLQRELGHCGIRALSSENAATVQGAEDDPSSWISEAIKNCKAVIPIISASSKHSPISALELKLVKRHHKAVLPLLHSGDMVIEGISPIMFYDHNDLLLSLKKIRDFLLKAGVVQTLGDSLQQSIKSMDPAKQALMDDDDSTAESKKSEKVGHSKPPATRHGQVSRSGLRLQSRDTSDLHDWLRKCNLAHITPQLRKLGAYEPADLQDLEDADLEGLNLKPLEIKRFKRVRQEYLAQIESEKRSSNSEASDLSNSSSGALETKEMGVMEIAPTETKDPETEASSVTGKVPREQSVVPVLKPLVVKSSTSSIESGSNGNSMSSRESIYKNKSATARRTKTVALLRPRAPVVVNVNSSILDVCKAMRARTSDCAVLTKEHWVAGIVTCTDLTKKVATTGKLLTDPIRSVMTPNPKCVAMEDDATEAMVMMIENNFRHLPVLDNEDNVVALLDIGRCIADAIGKIDRMETEQHEALSDAVAMATSTLTSSFHASSSQAQALQKALSPLVGSMFRQSDLGSVLEARETHHENEVVCESDTVREAARKMSITSRGVAVVDADKKLVGVFTPRDLNSRVLAKSKNLDECIVSDVMTDDPESADPSLSLLDALYRMHDSGVLQLTVVDEDSVLGMVNVFDILKATMGEGEESEEGWKSFLSGALASDLSRKSPSFPIRKVGVFSSLITPKGNRASRSSLSFDPLAGSFDGAVSAASAAAAAVAEVTTAYEEAHAVHDVVKGNWKCGKAIGAGSFGHVFQGLNTQTGELIAVKFLRVPNTAAHQGDLTASLKHVDLATVEAMAEADVSGKGGMLMGTDSSSDVGVRRIHSEVELMEGLRHPNIVRYLGAELYTDSVEHRLYILQEWVPGGSLEHLVRTYGVMKSEVTSRYLRDVLEGLIFLHEHDTVHRDLKPANVLVSDKGVAKLCDFGASRRLGKVIDNDVAQPNAIEGSPYYMAPEQMVTNQSKVESLGRKADVWSVGGMVLFMVTGDHPWQINKFRNVMALFAAVRRTSSTGPPLDSYSIDPLVKSFIQRCLVNEYDKRPSAEELLTDPLLALSEQHARRRSTIATPRSQASMDQDSHAPSVTDTDKGKGKKKVRIVEKSEKKSSHTSSVSALFPKLDPVELARKREKARERWAKVRKMVFETPDLKLVGKMPQFQQDMNAFAIPREDLKLSARPFAVGGGGQIYKGVYNRCTVAAKAIFSQMNDSKGTASRVEFHQEFSMLATLHHPNIVTFYGISEDLLQGILYIVEEFCAGGDLASYIVKSDAMNTHEYCRIGSELLGAVRYMHDKGIAHRDLKPQNVLLTENGRVKICDLGQARSFRKAAVTAAVGTAAYMPPEAFDEAVTSDSVYAASSWDTYSIGVMLWQLWYHEEPWGGKSTHKIYSSLMKGKRPPFNEPLPPPILQKLIEDMWHQDHLKRPTMREALRTFETKVTPLFVPDEPLSPATPLPMSSNSRVSDEEEDSEL